MDTLPPEPPDAPPPLPGGDDRVPGALIADRYRLIERIGDGAMGTVFLAEHEGLHRRVALKFLHDELTGNAEVAARFAREAVAAARIEHPHVIAVHDSGTDARGRCFLAMEYCQGEELRAVLLRDKVLTRGRALDLARQLAGALDHAHAMGIVHRDIKPENVLVLRRDDGGESVKVIDFGIAKVHLPDGPGGTALTRTGFMLGTPEYMSPEQCLGGLVDHRADLYALAITLYEMLSGRRPFDDDDVMAIVMRHLNAKPPPPSSWRPAGEIPPAVDAVFARALAKAPGDRFGTATELVEAIAQAYEAPPAPVVARRPRTPAQRLAARARDEAVYIAARWRSASRRAQASIVAASLVAVAAVATLAATRNPRPAVTPVAASLGVAHRPRAAALPAPAVREREALAARIEALRDRHARAGETARDRQRAAVELESTHLADPDDAAAAYVLGSLYARSRATAPQAVAAYRDALRAAPSLASDRPLVDDVVRIFATASPRSAPAEALLRGPLAESSLDAMVDACARAATGHARLSDLLAEAGFVERLDATQRAVLALTRARTCEARRAAVEALGREGDARALPALRRVPTGSGCGFLGLGTCNGCLGGAIPAAIRAIEARAAP
jgi:serine/threonine-protein kinase